MRISKSFCLSMPVLISTLLLLPACGGGGDTPTPEPETPSQEAEDFLSALGSGGYYGDAQLAGEDDTADEGGSDGEERTVEEADILFSEGEILYILNTYRGLQIFDLSDPDDPQLMGRVPIIGYPIEMYVRDGRAYVVVSDYFTYWRVDSGDEASSAAFHGSMLAIVDVENPVAPALLGKIDLEGYVSQTRAVGDVIYAVSTRYSYYNCYGASDDTEDMTYVVSVDISDPADPHAVDKLTWPGSYAQVHATSEALFVAEPQYDYYWEDGVDVAHEDSGPTEGSGSAGSGDTAEPPPTEATPAETDATPSETDDDETPRPDSDATPSDPDDDSTPPDEVDPVPPADDPNESYYRTRITYVDISDPAGTMQQRGSFDVVGYTDDKFSLDAFEDEFRVVTQKWDGETSGTLTILDVSDPDNITQLSTMDITLDVIESVTASRFDGRRGYIVTAESSDPLFIVDLEDPTEPILAGNVEMPGQLDHLELLGERIIALGQDNEMEGTWLFAVSLFDVDDVWNPTLLDRETIGDGTYSWSYATWDEKAFSLIANDDQSEGVIAVPFTAYNTDYTAYSGGVQLLSFDLDQLELRGMVTHPDYVKRVRSVGERYASLSDTHLLMIDVDDLDNPVVTADVTLARYVVDYLPMGDFGVQLTLPNSELPGHSGLRVVSADSPDATQESLGKVDFDVDDGMLLELPDDHFGVFKTTYDENWTPVSQLEIYDVSSPDSPALVSSLELPSAVWSWADRYSTYYGSSNGSLVRGDGFVAYLEGSYYYYDAVEDVEAEEDEPRPESEQGEDGVRLGKSNVADEPLSRLHIIDLSNIDSPTLRTMEFDQYLYGLRAIGDRLYATHAETAEDDSYARYYADVFDLAEPSAPGLSNSINIPGMFLHAMDDGQTLLTLDSQWATSTEGYDYLTYSIRKVGLANGGAYSIDSQNLDGYVYSVLTTDDAVYVLTQKYWWDMDYSDYCYYYDSMLLQTVGLGDGDSLQLTNEQELPLSYGTIRAAESGRLFIDGSYMGMLSYDIETNPQSPAFDDFARTSGWASRIRVDGGTVFLPTGMYGVVTFEL